MARIRRPTQPERNVQRQQRDDEVIPGGLTRGDLLNQIAHISGVLHRHCGEGTKREAHEAVDTAFRHGPRRDERGEEYIDLSDDDVEMSPRAREKLFYREGAGREKSFPPKRPNMSLRTRAATMLDHHASLLAKNLSLDEMFNLLAVDPSSSPTFEILQAALTRARVILTERSDRSVRYRNEINSWTSNDLHDLAVFLEPTNWQVSRREANAALEHLCYLSIEAFHVPDDELWSPQTATVDKDIQQTGSRDRTTIPRPLIDLTNDSNGD